MQTVIGLCVIVSWVWSVCIIVKKTKYTTKEGWVMLVGFLAFLLYIVGTINI